MSYFRKNIDAMSAYVPGEQPDQGAKIVKLNTNENPYPPSPRALGVLADFQGDRLRLYPDPMARAACRALADVLNLPADHVMPGNGSDDLIMMIVRACAGTGRPVAYPAPTFTFYRTQADIENAPVIEAPFGEDYALPADALVAARAAVTFVANPNSPSATATATAQLDELASRLEGLLVIDEAYVDFADSDALELIDRHDNVVVLRTLSKGYSLAGLRLGFGLAQPAVLAGLAKTKAIYTVDALAAAVGAAAITDQDHKNANAERIRASRGALAGDLEALGFRVWPSQANFLLARPPEGNAETVYLALKDRGILVRYFHHERLADKLRITVGTDGQNRPLIDALPDVLNE